ncbi:MAG: calcium/sodium antiporter [Rhizobiaceae bacterium]
MISITYLVVGLALLVAGGDALVRGAVGLAEKLNVPPLIIGLTIVALGTSAPELFVSVGAALNDAGGLAIGNVIGSNIANVLLVIGLPSLIKPTNCSEAGIRRNMMVMLGFTVVFMGMVWEGGLERYDGAILLALLVLFIINQFQSARRHMRKNNAEVDYREDVGEPPKSAIIIAALLAFGVIALPAGAELTVTGATMIAQKMGISDEVIGLTIVAVGTSLPELATSVVAVWRKNASVALGNVVGSNILNIALIMGVTALIVPVPIGDAVIYGEMWVMLATSVLLALFAHYRVTVGRRLGLAMTAAYIIFVISAFIYP